MDDPEVTAYLDALPDPARERVDQIRAAVHAAHAGVGERISYGIVTFTVDGRRAFHTGGYAGHVAVYPVPADLALAQRCAPYRSGKGTLKFPHREELPMELIEDVAAWFVALARG
ncbi:iron chaperone [Ornithinimicrobium sp. Y1847]|uniref:iron chaperone n=1 Tax=unclassified Ornithinimicrobium TaxID=2615080 RepID=UPI003B671DB7